MGHLHTVVPQTCTLMGSSEPTSLTSFFGFHHAAPCGHTEHATLSHGTCCAAHTHEILSVHTTHYVVHMQHATLFTQNILRFSQETFMAEGALHTHCATSTAPTGHSAQGPHCNADTQNDPAGLLSGRMAACPPGSVFPPPRHERPPRSQSCGDVLTLCSPHIRQIPTCVVERGGVALQG